MMRKPDILFLDGRAYSWRQLCELRQQQLKTWQKARPSQLALFELKDDHRPAAERTASDRYAEPTLLTFIKENCQQCSN